MANNISDESLDIMMIILEMYFMKILQFKAFLGLRYKP
jgi:hypothetical protein